MLLKYVRTGQLKRAFLIATSTGIAGIFLLVLQTNSPIWDAVQGLLKGMSVQSQSALSGMSGTSWVNRFFAFLFGSDYVMSSTPVRMVSLAISIAIITWLWLSAGKLSPMKQSILLLALPSILVPVSWNYNAIWVTLAIALLLNAQRATGEMSRVDILWLYPLGFALAVVPWVLVSPNLVNVGISELIFFPLIVGLITYWTISDSKKIF
jgi:hypothetical protein